MNKSGLAIDTRVKIISLSDDESDFLVGMGGTISESFASLSESEKAICGVYLESMKYKATFANLFSGDVIQTNKYYFLTSYENHKGGTNNLQVCTIHEWSKKGNTEKTFTSLRGMAEKRAQAWIKKNEQTIILQ